jgi:hypothetical protein
MPFYLGFIIHLPNKLLFINIYIYMIEELIRIGSYQDSIHQRPNWQSSAKLVKHQSLSSSLLGSR